jgi:hypothetical protein
LSQSNVEFLSSDSFICLFVWHERPQRTHLVLTHGPSLELATFRETRARALFERLVFLITHRQLQMYIHSNPIPNRTHKKSYTGCRACKARKVKVLLPSSECLLCLLSICLKCNEVKPICGKCSVHFKNIKSCDYGPSSRLKGKDGSSKKKDVVSTFAAPPTPPQSYEPLSSEGEVTTAALNPLHSLQNTRKRAAGQCPCPCPCHQPGMYT